MSASKGPVPPRGAAEPIESLAYIPVGDHQMYTVHHAAPRSAGSGPRAGVLIAGPIGAERERAYRTLVLLARDLATRGCDSLRFDFRGIGESTGQFEEFSLTQWQEDLHAAAALLRERAPGVPLIVLGVRGAALPLSRVFTQGLGDAMILLSPPKSGPDFLQDVLRRNLMSDMIANPNAPRQSREEIARTLEAGESANVDGYTWTGRLWHDAKQHELVLPSATERKPWHILDFKGVLATRVPASESSHHTVIASERFWETSPILVSQGPAMFEWVASMISGMLRMENAA